MASITEVIEPGATSKLTPLSIWMPPQPSVSILISRVGLIEWAELMQGLSPLLS
ncbi:MAG: hypothetical protein HHJ12_02920 [Glaciimonas sp.]|nr:hypothetical protein [Glaciimonas sp.]